MHLLPSFFKKETDSAEPAKTGGERFYDALQFVIGKVAIIAATAWLANVAKYGKDQYRGVPNYLKHFQGWFHDKLLTNKLYPMAEKGETAIRLAGAAANTMVTFHGGNAFAPIMQSMENSHEKIANAYNRRFGTPEDVEITHERLKDKPQQNWCDIAKGRIAAWAVVFSAFMGADALIGKDKATGMYKFDKYEESFGRKFAGFMNKGGKDIAKVPVGVALSKAQDASKMYRFGKILALDMYATSAALLVWNFVSRLSAEKRQAKKEPAAEPCVSAPATEEPQLHTHHTEAVAPKRVVHKPAADLSYLDKLAHQRQTPDAELAFAGPN